ncbi:MAG: hypothetical protein H7Y01_02735 [Ferruginibacter sp.]|nr:hypothetical protein [Chitinophagaceae bacterium]
MKDLIKQARTMTGAIAEVPGNKARRGNLIVAYLNKVLIEADHTDSDQNHKPSVFSTSRGSYFINGVPAILSQDEEAMLYDEELYEYV